MEGNNNSSSSPGASRWNPTKEQINMLESLYRQGLRTPSAEQIQQITGRLRSFGHIEGKNVFYWFQNHKARQRQKQKQENSIAYFNHFLQTPPVFPPCHNVVCSPYYMAPPQSNTDLGFYSPHHHQRPSFPLPKMRTLIPAPATDNNVNNGGIVSMEKNKQNRQRQDKGIMMTYTTTSSTSTSYVCSRNEEFVYTENNENPKPNSNSSQQTLLDLFPIHPTGILQSKTTTTHSTSASASAAVAPDIGYNFFDFLSGNDHPYPRT